ncbi:Mov34/MPN/PAD-1 family protein [Pseudomonas sp. HN2]|uniref:Mov34/MPN/PAD-1 family protein n=1 Tax=Pseudomonas sp. HN2 TaxID=2884805 RepID=UPI0022408293|nr:Mov34/MPN/PAD-1 family protein [Pseudomonas sp. HN2]
MRYVGERHTHPQNHPTPSWSDLSEWKMMAANRRDPRLLLALIVGCKGLNVETCSALESDVSSRR